MEAIKNKITDDRIRIGITHGDINGVSYEVILKSLSDSRMLELFIPVIYGHSKVASFYKKHFNLNELNLNIVRDALQAHPKRVNIVNCSEDELKIEMGVSTQIAGEAALAALEMAVADLRNDTLDAVVTAPINKQNIQSETFAFPGHTEYFASKFGVKNPLMLMCWNNLRVGTLTGHIALSDVAQMINKEIISKKLSVLNESLKIDFAINKPKIAVLGLNPHAGDGGLLGSEDDAIIAPAIEEARKLGIMAFGPFPADGFFGSGSWKKYDAVLAMYHDQGLAPFKTIAFDEGVNYTAGLPIVRTSPAHGTAYELAGKDEASEAAFRQAMYLAADISRNRAMHREITANPLKAANIPNN